MRQTLEFAASLFVLAGWLLLSAWVVLGAVRTRKGA